MNHKHSPSENYLDFYSERLENRQMLAGDVSVASRNGDVIISGDNANNLVRIESADTAGYIKVTGIAGTRINGRENGVRIEPLSDDLKINLKQGNNQLILGQQDNMLSVPDDLSIRMGRGDDVLVSPNLVVGDDVSIVSGRGFNRVTLFEAEAGESYTVGDDLKISSSGQSAINVDWRIAGDMRISTGRQSDEVDIFGATVAGDTTITTKAGDDTVEIKLTTLFGNLSVSTQGGDDSFSFYGDHAFGDIRLAMGSGFDSALITASLLVGTDIVTSGVENVMEDPV